MRPGVLVRDLARMWRAARRHPGERRAARRRDLGLAWVEAEARAGAGRRYRSAVTDLGPEPRAVRLVLDLWSGDGEPRQLGYATVELVTLPRARQVVEWLLSADGGVEAWCGRQVLEPRRTPGTGPAAGPCAVIVTLWHDGREVDRVTARQVLEALRP